MNKRSLKIAPKIGVDYHPFGMMMSGRSWQQNDSYRFGFQGMEGDDEVSGSGNSYSTHFRQYDSRLGRWFSVDPKDSFAPWESPYVGLANTPIIATDPKGDFVPVIILGVKFTAEAVAALFFTTAATAIFVVNHEAVEETADIINDAIFRSNTFPENPAFPGPHTYTIPSNPPPTPPNGLGNKNPFPGGGSKLAKAIIATGVVSVLVREFANRAGLSQESINKEKYEGLNSDQVTIGPSNTFLDINISDIKENSEDKETLDVTVRADVYYTVREGVGDALYDVARRYNVSIEQIAEWNNLRITDYDEDRGEGTIHSLKIGQTLKVGEIEESVSVDKNVYNDN